MASIEFLNERISKAEEFITKRQGTIERKQSTITKKIASLKKMGVEYSEGISARDHRDNADAFWTIVDIETLKEDIERAKRDIVDKQKSLDEYQAQLQSTIEKANSRNIPAILEFLEQWKQRVTESYHNAFEKYIKERTEFLAYDHEYTQWSNYEAWKMCKENPEEVDRRHKEYKERRNAFNRKWNFIVVYVDSKWDMQTSTRTYFFNDEKFKKDLDRDADAKYDFIIERTNAITGTITDATNLHVGAKGDLNGFIVGERGTAKVETIGAGGYNIQCFHFRTLINRY